MKKRLLALAAVLAFAAACTAEPAEAPGPTGSPTPEPWHGGTLRVMTWLRTVQQLDPVTSYIGGIHWEIYRCCLLRTVMSYNGLPAVDGGAEPLPDLAAEPPDVTSDGLIWTFRLREGLRYAPPWHETEIVAQDVVRAIERIPPPGPQVLEYGFYFSVIEGFDAYRAGEADSISGLETPDDHTLIVRLTEPAGDLPYRFSLHATAPVPAGASDGHERDWFRFLAASGPYMIEGSEDLDFSLPPKEQEPVSGFTPQEEIDMGSEAEVGLTLVRNPAWDRATDPLRPAYLDRIEFTMVPTAQLFARASIREFGRRLERGTIDLLPAQSATQLERFRSDPELGDRVLPIPQSDLDYLPMNLAVRPFDDVHVRRAINLAVDRTAITSGFEAMAPFEGQLLTPLWHVFPGAMSGGLLDDRWRPAWAAEVESAGDLSAARREMAASRYDDDGDGRCDDPVCAQVRALVDRGAYGPGIPYRWYAKQIAEDLSGIGIEIDRDVRGCFPTVESAQRPADRNPLLISVCMGWVPDYPSGATFAQPLLSGGSIGDEGNGNSSLLGATGDQLRGWGYGVSSVPSVDDRIDTCMTQLGQAQIECWADLDTFLMEEVVPWVPLFTTSRVFLISERVTNWSYSELGLRPAFDRIALVPGSE